MEIYDFLITKKGSIHFRVQKFPKRTRVTRIGYFNLFYIISIYLYILQFFQVSIIMFHQYIYRWTTVVIPVPTTYYLWV